MQDKKNFTLVGMLVVVGLIVGAYFYKQLFSVPANFPVNKNFTVNENESLKSVSERLVADGYISSSLFFRVGISFFNKDRAIQVGGYSFSSPQALHGVVDTFVRGHPSSPLLSVTIPEGSTSFEVATIVTKALPSLTVSGFNELINQNNANGKLFPSTYFLLPSYTGADIIRLMLSTFTKKVEGVIVASDIPSPLTSSDQVLILASIVEGEAKTEVDMKMVAGILLTRLTKGMPLQVDVAKETYKVKGLPKEPINNPGLVAIGSVLHPTFTDNLYYLTGDDGLMYYAKTFEEHKKNVKRYLK